MQALLKEGRRCVTVEFAQDGHFLQKFRAEFLAESAAAIFEAANKD